MLKAKHSCKKIIFLCIYIKKTDFCSSSIFYWKHANCLNINFDCTKSINIDLHRPEYGIRKKFRQ